ncbi:HAD family phosphatase [Aliishimia ponticola]|uniref:HAD family phosphatase n=1 Tax=Aliishimia ponticola TaxID=2499833 RepID=A0A4S4NGB6_9RHOB|nr:HAD family phosphatase [Aliishimia ponticola]THH38696.1 HAD family phosphatase [Aliishimia ponticola]
MLDRIDAFLFDMDGLLLDTERVFMELAVDLLDPFGFSRAETEGFFLTLVGSSSTHTQARLEAFLGDRLDPAAFYDTWYTHLKARLADGIPLRPMVRESLEAARATGRPMAVVTSTRGKVARHHLEVAGLSGFFDHVTAGDEVSQNKPHPAPYAETAQKLGVAPTACAAFEDSDKGIASAMAAGCVSFQIPDLRAPDVPLPELGQHVVPSLDHAMRKLGVL